jgi:putative transposase
MPRLPRFNIADVAQHVVQRGNNRCACFFGHGDYAIYLEWLGESAALHSVAVHAYALMPNHVHLLVTPAAPGAVSGMMQMLGRRYVRFVNRSQGRSGTLWEGRFKACVVDTERYVLTAYRYIDLNPVRAGIVVNPGSYRWSSYAANAGLRGDGLLSAHECYRALGTTGPQRAERYGALCGQTLDPQAVSELRAMSRSELAFGSDRFKDDIAAAAARRTRPIERARSGARSARSGRSGSDT